MNPFRPISTSFSPNTEADDILLALKILFSPWHWQEGKEIKILEKKFKDYFRIRYAFPFNGGRAALMTILTALCIKKDDEVLLQAFTCNAAVNPILWRRAKPVFVDIDETLNLDPEDLERKITKKSKVVMIQHTFGWPAKITRIKDICQKHNLFLIEDCAHSLGAKYKEILVGTFGDAAFFSFGRDKVMSSVYGGMAITNNDEIGKKLEETQNNLPLPSNGWILQQILHPIAFAFALPIYSFLNIGKGILFLKQKLKILSPSVYPKEKKGKLPKYFPKKLPNALAILALNQFEKLDRFNQHRREIAEIYRRRSRQTSTQIYAEKENDVKPIYMRYPVFIKNAKKIREKLKIQNILLDDGWHTLPIIPPGTDLKKMNYIKNSWPRVEEVARTIINLPTGVNISKKEAKKIMNILKDYGN